MHDRERDIVVGHGIQCAEVGQADSVEIADQHDSGQRQRHPAAELPDFPANSPAQRQARRDSDPVDGIDFPGGEKQRSEHRSGPDRAHAVESPTGRAAEAAAEDCSHLQDGQAVVERKILHAVRNTEQDSPDRQREDVEQEYGVGCAAPGIFEEVLQQPAFCQKKSEAEHCAAGHRKEQNT